MKTIYLHGYAARYGEKFELDIQNPKEAIRALAMQIPGFEEMVRDGEWHLVRGPLDLQDADDEERLELSLRDGEQIHLLPAIKGAGGGGGMSILIGIALVAIAFIPGVGPAISMGLMAAGAGMIVGGIIQMTMKIPGADTSSSESKDSKASFLFAGPKNQSTQGVAIPRGYGRCRVGSVVISAGLYAEELTA